jgi:hypothetical protein
MGRQEKLPILERELARSPDEGAPEEGFKRLHDGSSSSKVLACFKSRALSRCLTKLAVTRHDD